MRSERDPPAAQPYNLGLVAEQPRFKYRSAASKLAQPVHGVFHGLKFWPFTSEKASLSRADAIGPASGVLTIKRTS